MFTDYRRVWFSNPFNTSIKPYQLINIWLPIEKRKLLVVHDNGNDRSVGLVNWATKRRSRMTNEGGEATLSFWGSI